MNEISFLQIDEEGYLLSNEMRLQDKDYGKSILENLQLSENGAWTVSTNSNLIIEPFDEPLVAAQVEKQGSKWFLILPYEVHLAFDLSSLSLDEWDRFHGYTTNGIPFVLSRKAQNTFFQLMDEFTDDSITVDGKTFDIPPLYSETPEIEQEKWWTDIYIEETRMHWNLNAPAEALKDMLPRLKLRKSRILVLGCGEGHDAAFFAEHGHLVTAIDISPEAIRRGQKKYGHLLNLKFIESDLFKLLPEHRQSYDLVFEHTCFCAINPTQRQKLVQLWSQLLAEGGQILGVFFTMEKKIGPPFGGSEWEIRQRLKDKFDFLLWGRWRQSIPRRQGKELFVYAQKKLI